MIQTEYIILLCCLLEVDRKIYLFSVSQRSTTMVIYVVTKYNILFPLNNEVTVTKITIEVSFYFSYITGISC